ncbi:MAG TPA: hypothetical protein VFS45_01905 [Sphingomicrobium sp.]|nr:hypothetical protein [Sphingomicrobium sp.]
MRGKLRRALATGGTARAFEQEGDSRAMQQLPPFPDETPEPPQPGQPSQPGRPSEAPNESPPTAPDIDVPSPSQPATDPSPTPISPVGRA